MKNTLRVLSVCLLITLLVPLITIATPTAKATPDPTIYTCNVSGNQTSTFNPSVFNSALGHTEGGDGDVYVNVTGLSASTTYPLYVFLANSTFTFGDSFSAMTPYFAVPINDSFPHSGAPAHTQCNITTNSLGSLSSLKDIYTTPASGNYIVIVDVNNNGTYESDDLAANFTVTFCVSVHDGDGTLLKVRYLTPDEIYSMPSYTGVGSPRRNGGFYPLAMIGNYTGVPLQYICNEVGGMSEYGIATYYTPIDGYYVSQGYEQVYENLYTQYNISTHEIITGQNPMIILAYKVNGTMLYSDCTDSDSDLGGAFRLFVVSNNGTSPILANDGMATFGYTYVKYISNLDIMNPGTLSCNTTDGSGNKKSTFYNANDTVYLSATGFDASTTYPVYIVPHEANRTVRVLISSLNPEVSTTVTTDISGAVTNAVIWNLSNYGNLAYTDYDVIMDLNDNSKLDDNDFMITNTVEWPGPGIHIIVPDIEICNSDGILQTTFVAQQEGNGDFVYLNATGLAPSTSYWVFTVPHRTCWTVGASIDYTVWVQFAPFDTDSSGNVEMARIDACAYIDPGGYDLILSPDPYYYTYDTYVVQDTVIANVTSSSGPAFYVVPFS